MANLPLLAAVSVIGLLLFRGVVKPLYLSPLSRIPGSKTFAITKWRLAYEEWCNRRTRSIDRMHREYGPVVRTGPNEVHFNSLSALRTIYRSGSGYGRTSFYRMFDVYGKQNLFTFFSDKSHGGRKRLVSHAYAKSTVLRDPAVSMVGEKINDYLQLVKKQGEKAHNVYWTLHYYSLDVITTFLYGADLGGTRALQGFKGHQALLDDIATPGRRGLTWYTFHFPSLTKWLYDRSSLVGRLVAPFLPMQTYTNIRAHALAAMQAFRGASTTGELNPPSQQTVCGRLFAAASKDAAGLSDLDIASECADHFLAGIDTTSDSLMFLIWALSQPGHWEQQRKMIEEARSIPESELDEFGNPTPLTADRLPYLNAIIMETLRLYAPIPESEPRSAAFDAVIDGYEIPAGTIVSMSPYSLHRNERVFPAPLDWHPERWIGDGEDIVEMKKWFWAFSSGGRMCVGKHLALSEFALVPAIYRRYSTRIKPGFEGKAPAITSRVETFADELFNEQAVRLLRHAPNLLLT